MHKEGLGENYESVDFCFKIIKRLVSYQNCCRLLFCQSTYRLIHKSSLTTLTQICDSGLEIHSNKNIRSRRVYYAFVETILWYFVVLLYNLGKLIFH